MSLPHKNKLAKTSRLNLFRSRAKFTFLQSLVIRISNFSDSPNLDPTLLQLSPLSLSSKKNFSTKTQSKSKTTEKSFVTLKNKCSKNKQNSSKSTTKKWTQVPKKKNSKTWKNNSKDKKAKSRNLNLKISAFTKENSSSVLTLLVSTVKSQKNKKLISANSSYTLNSLGSHRKKINSKKISNCIFLFRSHPRMKAINQRDKIFNNNLRIWSKKRKKKSPRMKRLKKLRITRNYWNLKVTQWDLKRQRSTWSRIKTWSFGTIYWNLTSSNTIRSSSRCWYSLDTKSKIFVSQIQMSLTGKKLKVY